MVLSLLSGQGLIDGSEFLPLPPVLSLALHKVLLYVEKNPAGRKTSFASLGGNPGGAGVDVRSRVRRDSLSYNHIFILLLHVLH